MFETVHKKTARRGITYHFNIDKSRKPFNAFNVDSVIITFFNNFLTTKKEDARWTSSLIFKKFNSVYYRLAIIPGTTSKRSATIPYVAMLKIGASGSLFTATIHFDPFIPATCCTAPDIPRAR